ncbi:MAG: hypothetical protein AB7P23_05460 [Amphiplicatus sp.]
MTDNSVMTAPLETTEDEDSVAVFILSSRDERLIALEKIIEAKGYLCTTFSSSDDALAAARRAGSAKKVLFIDGLCGSMPTSLDSFAEAPADLVLVLISGGADYAQISDALRKAAFMVLKAPMAKEMLDCVVDAAVNEAGRRLALAAEWRRMAGALKRIETGKFRFRTIEEADALSRLLAFAFPEPDRAARGLSELMHNAVEHGNLEIGFREKSRLLDDDMLGAEIARRLQDPRYQARVAEAVLARRDDGVYVVIKDAGAGFDWSEFVKFSPARAAHRNGRGIQVARLTCFDKLSFNETGNLVSVFTSASGD